MEISFIFVVVLFAYMVDFYQNTRSNTGHVNYMNKQSTMKVVAFYIVLIYTFLLVAFRDYNAYIDTARYTDIFNYVKVNGLRDVKLHTEIGYNILVYAFTVFNTPLPLNIFCTFIIFYSIAKFIKKHSPDYLFSIIIFLSAYFIYTANIVRHMISAAILLIAFDMFVEKKDIKGIGLVLLATTFHKTAIIFLSVYFFRFIRVPQKTAKYLKTIILVTVSIVVIAYVMHKLKLHRYFNYLNTYNGFYKQKFAYVLIDLISLLLFLSFRNKKESRIPIWTLSVALIFDALSIFNSLMSRIGIMFNLFVVAYLPEYLMKKNKLKGTNLYKLAILSSYIGFFTFKVALSPDLSSFFPWKFAKIFLI